MYNAAVKIVYRDQQKMVFRVYPDSVKLKYVPGQYGALGLNRNVPRIDNGKVGQDRNGSLIKRAYSISSSISDDQGNLTDPARLEYYEFYIDLVLADESTTPRLSPRLFSLNDGDRIFIGHKIVGHYTLTAREKGKNLLFISTTTGEAPHNAMINEILNQKEDCHLCNIIIGKRGWTTAYSRNHQEIAKRFPAYKYISLVNENGYQNIVQIVEECLQSEDKSKTYLGWAMDSNHTHVYLCGDPQMIGAPVKLGGWRYEYPDYGLMRLLEKYGFNPVTRFQPGNISYETYW